MSIYEVVFFIVAVWFACGVLALVLAMLTTEYVGHNRAWHTLLMVAMGPVALVIVCSDGR